MVQSEFLRGLKPTTLFSKLRDSDILFNSNHLTIVNKRALVASQPDESSRGRDLVALVKQYLRSKLKHTGNLFSEPVHRIDRAASGCVCFARTSKAASRMASMFAKGEVEKDYIALVAGDLDGRGVIPAGGSYASYWKSRSVKSGWEDRRRDNKRFEKEDGQLEWCALKKITDMENFQETKETETFTLLAVRITTGRKHQIRRQLASIRAPIVGDVLYGSRKRIESILHRARLADKKPSKKPLQSATTRKPSSHPSPIMLHAAGLTFKNPVIARKEAGNELPKRLGKRKIHETIRVHSTPPRWWRSVFRDLSIPNLVKQKSYFDLAVSLLDKKEIFETSDIFGDDFDENQFDDKGFSLDEVKFETQNSDSEEIANDNTTGVGESLEEVKHDHQVIELSAKP